MPTVLRHDGFNVMIYVRDEHPPPHVHIRKAEGQVVVYLGDENAAPSLREVIHMGKRDARMALSIVEDNQEALLHRWREIHG